MKISIITPTYNRASLIERAIQSVLSQTHQDFEMIIVDDASEDHTEQVVSNYKNDTRIRYYRLEHNSGVNKARNFGLARVAEEVEAITFLDSDDEFTSDALYKIKKRLEKYTDVNSFRFAVQYKDGKIVSNKNYVGKTLDFVSFVNDMYEIGEWVCVFRKCIIDGGFRYIEDIDAFEVLSYIKLAKEEKQYFSSDIVRTYYVGHESISNTQLSGKKMNNSIKAYERMLLILGDRSSEIRRKTYGRILYALSYFYMLSGNKKKGFLCNLRAFRKNPFDLRFFRNLIKLI
ncbi:glycosyl transferase family 2 [Riemerella anatipestifer]|uniref:glycosyltransferase family 2 protein n=1 Tax=Riemerella anatipestifer TaxID=34085 RepID=UPI0007ECF476|nr:glycosyltransferase family 2 protein [Riemerella anatipestifer]OBP56505.1 glycosyl transferase family 2 [Riemerella anatipestifer]